MIKELLINKPDQVLKMAKKFYEDAIKKLDKTLKTREEKMYAISNFVKQKVAESNYFSSQDVIAQFSDYLTAIDNWTPNLKDTDLSVASTFQGALRDHFLEVASHQLFQQGEKILLQIEQMQDPGLDDIKVKLIQNIKSLKEDEKHLYTLPLLLEATQLIAECKKELVLRENIQAILRLLSNYKEVLNNYCEKSKLEYLSRVQKGNLNSKTASLGAENINNKSMIELADKLESVLRKRNISPAQKLENFQKEFYNGFDKLNAVKEHKSKGFLKVILDLLKKIVPYSKEENGINSLKKTKAQLNKMRSEFADKTNEVVRSYFPQI